MKHVSAQLSTGMFKLEYAEIVSALPGPTITITAGMDGDEYVSIETARILCDRYIPTIVRGHIHILPLINSAGYAAHVGRSPIDEKYPKLVFPGSNNGTHTEQLMHWLYETYIKHTDIWIDLHGGSTDEELHPFIWIYKSKHEDIRAEQQVFLNTTHSPVIVCDRNPFMNYSSFLDTAHIVHILMECGDQGGTRQKDIHTLTSWIDDALRAYGVLPGTLKKRRPSNEYASVRYIVAPYDGFWQQNHHSDKTLGVLMSADLKQQTEIAALNEHMLWKNTGPFCYRGDVIAAYALSD